MKEIIEIIGEEKSIPISILKYTFKLYDAFGAVCYSGDDYRKAKEKAIFLPGMMALYVFDKDNKYVGAIWAAPNSGIPVIKIDTLYPN